MSREAARLKSNTYQRRTKFIRSGRAFGARKATYMWTQEWHNNLRMEYCKNVSSKTYSITPETIDIVLGKTPNNRAPGTDHIVGYWLKRCSSLHEELRQQMILLMEGQEIMPPWLATCRTILIPKNSATHLPNNYRPMACQKSMLYTGILNLFLDDHCISNNIIYDEQAGGKERGLGLC